VIATSPARRRAPATRRPALRAAGAFALLCAVTILSLSPVLRAGFAYDDHGYLLDNPNLTAGWAAGLRWAATTFYAANWHPLTWVSHMADLSLFGYDARAHHAVNLALHALNAVVLFLFLRGATGYAGRSLFVALAFAVHPLHVETAAWVAQRKDLLATLFWFLALGAYLRQVRRPALWRAAAVPLLFAAALLAKPMPLTLPLLLLLLDLWPLGLIPIARGAPRGAWLAAARRRVLTVTFPLLALSLASAAVTVTAQRSGGALESLERLPLAPRLENAALAAAGYLRQGFWPADLAVFYPHPGGGMAPARAAAAALALATLTAGAIVGARRRPHLTVGWCWYLVTLLPVIGVIQVGSQGSADRYTYVPLVGVSLAAAFEACGILRRRARPWLPAAALAAVAIAALGAAARLQAGFWRDDVTLYEHAIAVGDSWVMQASLGEALTGRGRFEQAAAHLTRAIALNPGKAPLWYNLGTARLQGGAPGDAIADLRRALELQPVFPEALLNLGTCYARLGRRGPALEAYQRALAQRPGFADALVALGLTLEDLGLTDQALARIREAIANPPLSAETATTVAQALTRLGDPEEGARVLREARRSLPAHAGDREGQRAAGAR
jgi:tetratricopeptide (TPR) repeat protein